MLTGFHALTFFVRQLADIQHGRVHSSFLPMQDHNRFLPLRNIDNKLQIGG